MSVGEILEVWADDPEVLHDMPLLLKRCGDCLLSVEERIGEYRLLIQVQQGGV
jgi:TusA-related sulfurtransferase